MKLAVICLSLVSSISAQAFSGSISANMSNNDLKEKRSEGIGLSMSHPLLAGFSWWSWTGAGQIHEKQKPVDRYAQTLQALEFNLKAVKLTGTAKFQWENNFKDYSPEYGVRVSVKLW